MKKLLLLLLTIASLQVKSQFINLPDSNLRNSLYNIAPVLFNSSKQLDTTLSKFLNMTSLNYINLTGNNISNLTGIEYIHFIFSLNISCNNILVFNDLPPNCVNLEMRNCGFTNLPIALTKKSKLQEVSFVSNLDSFNNTKFLKNKIQDFSTLFNSHTAINLSYCDYTIMPVLPNFIKKLVIRNNLISAIPQLSDSLEYLDCFYNNLTSLPTLPNKLTFLYCGYNKLTTIPNFPAGIYEIDCRNNLLPSLPNNLPFSLELLDCSENRLTTLPSMPNKIRYLKCNDNILTTLPYLPNSITNITCNNNQIISFPNVPSNFESLSFGNNLLSTLPLFPKPINLIEKNKLISFQNNKLTTTPKLFDFDSVNYIVQLNNNLITNLDSILLIKSITYLDVSNLPVSKLPDTINIRDYFICNSNKFNKLPYFKNKRGAISFVSTTFDTINNNNLPDSLGYFDMSYSNVTKFSKTRFSEVLFHGRPDIKCLPILPENINLYTNNINIKCLPNSMSLNGFQGKANTIINTSDYDSIGYLRVIQGLGYVGAGYPLPFNKYLTLPICNPTNNINNCFNYPTIIGSVFIDENNNNVKDSGEIYKANVLIQLSNSSRTSTNYKGDFALVTPDTGYQSVTIKSPRFYNSVPQAINLTITNKDSLINISPFALQKTISKDSLAIKITPINWAARPGFAYPFFVQYENVGSNTVNANINVSFNSNALNYDYSSTTVNATTGNIQLLKNSFTPGIQGGFISYFKVKPSASLLGTNLKTWATIAGGAATAADTTSRIIGGSYDPNDKLSTPRLSTTQVAEGEFINYTVRFQNTGTDTAFTVVIADTLSSLLQTNTFEMLGSSHTCKTIIQDNKIYFEFRNILLPDSSTNLIGSNGFVNFRIKPISSVVLNTVIPNKAAIYFDYNEPIITNTATTLISNTILPLQLIRFNVLYKQGSGVLFNWETKNEQAIKAFVVEESKDAINFKALKQEASKGNGDNNYFSNANYATNEMIGSKFYRLKTISNNGNIAYSQIVKLNFEKSIQPFIILQNPVKGSLQIQVNAQSLNNTEALLLNQEGKVLQGFKLQLGSQTIGLSNLGAGIYTLKTKEGSKLVVIAP